MIIMTEIFWFYKIECLRLWSYVVNNILIATEHELPDNPPLQKVKKPV